MDLLLVIKLPPIHVPSTEMCCGAPYHRQAWQKLGPWVYCVAWYIQPKIWLLVRLFWNKYSALDLFTNTGSHCRPLLILLISCTGWHWKPRWRHLLDTTSAWPNRLDGRYRQRSPHPCLSTVVSICLGLALLSDGVGHGLAHFCTIISPSDEGCEKISRRWIP